MADAARIDELVNESAKRTCPKCRENVFAKACFCIRCGAALEEPSRQPSRVTLAAYKPTAQDHANARGSVYSLTSRGTGYSLAGNLPAPEVVQIGRLRPRAKPSR